MTGEVVLQVLKLLHHAAVLARRVDGLPFRINSAIAFRLGLVQSDDVAVKLLIGDIAIESARKGF